MGKMKKEVMEMERGGDNQLRCRCEGICSSSETGNSNEKDCLIVGIGGSMTLHKGRKV